MKQDKTDPADELFKHAPKHAQELHKKSKQLRREVERKEWWASNKHLYGK